MLGRTVRGTVRARSLRRDTGVPEGADHFSVHWWMGLYDFRDSNRRVLRGGIPMLYRKAFYALVSAATVLVGGNGIALAKKGPACSAAGRIIATKSPLVATQLDAAGLFSVTIVTVSATSVTLAIPGCAPATVKLKRGGTVIKAKWTSCTGLTGKVQLMGTVVKGCKRINGTLSQSKGKPKHKHFTASLTMCGDGIVDSGNNELCDGNCGSGCDPSTCTCTGQTGGTGAFGIITVNGKQKMYLPQTSPSAAGHGVVS